jgi:hypothetical protein
MSLFRVPQIWRSKDLDYFTSRASLDPSDLFRSSPRTPAHPPTCKANVIGAPSLSLYSPRPLSLFAETTIS